MNNDTVKAKKKSRNFVAVVVAVLIGFLVLTFASYFTSSAMIDDTPYKNTKYFVEWDNYVFSNVNTIKSQLTKDYIAYKSMDTWVYLDADAKSSLDAMYKIATNSREYCRLSTQESGRFYTGLTRSNLNKLRDSLLKTKALYTSMEVYLTQFDSTYLGYYSDQSELVSTAIKYLSKESINAISEVSKIYGNSVPKKYFKVSYKTVTMEAEGEVESYNSLYTPLVRGNVTLVYDKSEGTKYNDTVVSLGKGKGYIIYPMSIVGRVRYVKVTYICK